MATHQNTGGTVVSSYTYAVNPISQRASVTTASIVFADSNSIVECSVHSSSFNLHHSFSWGLDLSGTMQGAGGVGGLLATRWNTGVHYFPTYDGNGNVSEYLATNGGVTVHYEYDPFGNLTRLTGNTSTRFSFRFRFSTKPRDPATGLYYYGYRWYDPYTGRWINRDPIEERGGFNLYGMVKNRTSNIIDVLGNGPLIPAVVGGFGADVAVPEPSDAVWVKWAGWGAVFVLAAAGDSIIDAVVDDGPPPPAVVAPPHTPAPPRPVPDIDGTLPPVTLDIEGKPVPRPGEQPKPSSKKQNPSANPRLKIPPICWYTRFTPTPNASSAGGICKYDCSDGDEGMTAESCESECPYYSDPPAFVQKILLEAAGVQFYGL